jgi:hypothetical protein
LDEQKISKNIVSHEIYIHSILSCIVGMKWKKWHCAKNLRIDITVLCKLYWLWRVNLKTKTRKKWHQINCHLSSSPSPSSHDDKAKWEKKGISVKLKSVYHHAKARFMVVSNINTLTIEMIILQPQRSLKTLLMSILDRGNLKVNFFDLGLTFSFLCQKLSLKINSGEILSVSKLKR